MEEFVDNDGKILERMNHDKSILDFLSVRVSIYKILFQ